MERLFWLAREKKNEYQKECFAQHLVNMFSEEENEDMQTASRPKLYDLEQRTLAFAQRVRIFLRRIPKTESNIVDGRQLLRSSGSIGANYIEANESLGKKDAIMHMRISKKEAKESFFWLQLIQPGTEESVITEWKYLLNEARQYIFIFQAITKKMSIPKSIDTKD